MTKQEAALRDDFRDRSLRFARNGGSENPSGNARLILVPTPIGNLGDITKRSLEAFENCDAVFCEDTRVTGKLLTALGISKPLYRMDENSISEHVSELIDKAQAGQTICYCSDAGMPAISDPGSRIVAAAREAGVEVEVLPGANAALVALVQSGFDTSHFYFEGFLPKKASAKHERLAQIMAFDCPAIVYESPNRIDDTLHAVAEIDPNRKVCIARELTKLHEEVIIDKVSNAQVTTQKGEIVLVIDGAAESSQEATINQSAVDDYIKTSLERGITKKDICSDLQKYFGLPRNRSYQLVNLK